MDRQDAIEYAKEAAAKHPESYTNTADFQPHEWVIQAIMKAGSEGFSNGFDEGFDEGYEDGYADGEEEF